MLRTQQYKNIRMGRINDPLLRINLDNVIPDELHLILRITDVLIRNLIHAAASHDARNGRSVRLLESIRSCGVSFNSNKAAFNFTSLVGSSKLKLLEKLPPKLKDCQPGEFLQPYNSFKNLRTTDFK